MDSEQLKLSLKSFVEECAAQGKPLTNVCVRPAYPGDSSSSFIVEVKADWIDDMTCSPVLDFLYDVLFATTTPQIRQNIFTILILDSTEQVHCIANPNDKKEDDAPSI
jgi:hypothetical protein